MTIGFIGLGLIGLPMAKNILAKGFSLSVYARTQGKTDGLVSRGVAVATSPKELAARVDCVITMVTSGRDVKEIALGKNGLVEGAHPGLVHVDMSTIGPSSARSIAKKLSPSDIEFIDAPVTGSTPKAISGELTIFIGGKKDVVDRIEPVLRAMGTTLLYMGEVGAGQAIKLVNNQILAASFATIAESILLSKSLGIDIAKAVEVLLMVPATSPMMRLKLPNYITDTYPLLFSIANMKKDITLAQKELAEHNSHLPLIDKLVELYNQAVDEGFKDEDVSAIIKSLKN